MNPTARSMSSKTCPAIDFVRDRPDALLNTRPSARGHCGERVHGVQCQVCCRVDGPGGGIEDAAAAESSAAMTPWWCWRTPTCGGRRGLRRGVCFNAGRPCAAIERLHVVDSAHDRFVTELERAFDDLAVGGEDRRDIGPLVLPGAPAALERQVREAVAAGATLHCGGSAVQLDGRHYFRPTLLTGVPHDARIVSEESLGPVLPVVRGPDEETAIRLANDSAAAARHGRWRPAPRRCS